MKKKPAGLATIFLPILVVILLLAAGAGVFWLYQQRSSLLKQQSQTQAPAEEAEVSPSPIPLPTEASGPAGPEATESAEAEDQQVTDLELIRTAMAARHSKTVAETEMTMSKYDGEYAQGGVHFAGEMGGGWWLAAKTSSGWVIVADGNGTVMCDDIAPYDFPTIMVPECWDEATGELIIF